MGIEAEELLIGLLENANWKFKILKYIFQQFTFVNCLKANNSNNQSEINTELLPL